jgi:hypothetical protein
MAQPMRVIEMWTTRGRTYFHVRHRNGRVTDPSQGYANSSNAYRAIRNNPNIADLPIKQLEEAPR